MARIERGTQIEVQDANGSPLVRRALGGVVDQARDGQHLDVVWACTEAEWDAAQAAGREPEGNAWPAQNVRALE